MISQKLQDALNDQIAFEFYSAYIYYAMSHYFESIDLPGFANWMRIQTQEELAHGHKMADYLNERDGRAMMKGLEQPQLEWESPLNAFQHAYEHEQIVTGRINNLVTLAREENDYATYNFLQWFVDEQVEEESSVKAIIQDLKMVGEHGQGLFMINRELAQRVFNNPLTPTQV